MTQERPHRRALTPDAAAKELTHEAANGKLDREAVDAVLAAVGHVVPEAVLPAGLTKRA
jgi:HD-GYP domain-containing protein (c-di-GMP phosphodiesterase class II)